MADEFTLTNGLLTVWEPKRQDLSQALDVSAYDEADLLLQVPHIEGTPSPSLAHRDVPFGRGVGGSGSLQRCGIGGHRCAPASEHQELPEIHPLGSDGFHGYQPQGHHLHLWDVAELGVIGSNDA
jgi:hypothetical protein